MGVRDRLCRSTCHVPGDRLLRTSAAERTSFFLEQLLKRIHMVSAGFDHKLSYGEIEAQIQRTDGWSGANISATAMPMANITPLWPPPERVRQPVGQRHLRSSTIR